MVRPDFALQLMMRTLPNLNQHENPEYQTLRTAVKELKRLYDVEMWAREVLESDPASDEHLTARAMLRLTIRSNCERGEGGLLDE